jgi:hypothetical protein
MTFLNYHSFFTDRVLPVIGAIYLSVCVPVVAVQIVITTMWGGLMALRFKIANAAGAGSTRVDVTADKVGGLVDKNGGRRPQWMVELSRACDGYSRSQTDGDIVLWAFFMAVVIPGVWFAVGVSGSIPLAVGYNVLRIGPMYTFFAHSYTLCHMEVHHRSKLFVTGDAHPASNIFNWWAGTGCSLVVAVLYNG